MLLSAHLSISITNFVYSFSEEIHYKKKMRNSTEICKLTKILPLHCIKQKECTSTKSVFVKLKKKSLVLQENTLVVILLKYKFFFLNFFNPG